MSSTPSSGIKDSPNVSWLNAFVKAVGDKPTVVDAATAVALAAEDGDVSRREAAVLDSFIQKLPPNAPRMSPNQLQKNNGKVALNYAQALLTQPHDSSHHLKIALTSMMKSAQSPADAQRIVSLVGRNPSLLPDALKLAADLNSFTSRPMQSAVHAPLLKLRGGYAREYPYTPIGADQDTFKDTQGNAVVVKDPYRALEESNSPRLKPWIQAQNALTDKHIDSGLVSMFLDSFKGLRGYSSDAKIGGLVYGNAQKDYDQNYSIDRGGYLYTAYNDTGLRDQAVIYRQKGGRGPKEKVLDPNTFSKNNSIHLKNFNLSPDGKFVVIGLTKGGADWEELYVVDMKHLPITHLPPKTPPVLDHIKWAATTEIAWDNKGFYYSRYDEPAAGTDIVTAQKVNRRVFFHTLGTSQTQDKEIYRNPNDPIQKSGYPSLYTTADQRFVLLDIENGRSGKNGNTLHYVDRNVSKEANAFKPLISTLGEFKYSVVGHLDGKLLMKTNDGAPSGQLVLIDPATFDPNRPARAQWKVILPERPGPLLQVLMVNGKLIARYAEKSSTQLYVYDLKTQKTDEIKLPSIGTVDSLEASSDGRTVRYTYESFIQPLSTYEFDTQTLKSKAINIPKVPNFNPDDYVVTQYFFTVKDVLTGQEVVASMFIMARKDTPLNGQNPILMSVYGGFADQGGVPRFGIARLALMDKKKLKVPCVYALLQLPGDGHLGETSHQQGIKQRKPNTFNAVAAGARELINMGYTSAGRIALFGSSNGGLTAVATAMQNPELFGAVVAHNGVYDMCRYPKHTVGGGWVGDYGLPNNPAEFETLISYSPVHTAKPGQHLPPLCIMTSNGDDRVAAGHSLKLAATLQENAGPQSTVLLSVDGKGMGHSSGGNTSLDETMAKAWAFCAQSLGIERVDGKKVGNAKSKP